MVAQREQSLRLVRRLGGELDLLITSTSQSDGSYAIRLSAGMYEVRLVGFAPLQLYYGRDPNHYDRWPLITVNSGQDTKLDLVYDSKIR
jgi:hypothetical protein